MKASIDSVAWVVVSALVSGCGGTVTLRANAPPPPPAEVTVGVEAPAPPAPSPPSPPSAPEATVEVEPVTEGDPEEVSATTEPPDPVYEEETPAPSPGYVWVGGYWGWNGIDWGWNWGRWESPPTGRVYIQPYYERVGPRVVYVRGYWGSRDSPHRSYGGERIRWNPPPRPANYHRGERVVIEHRAGPPPGKRPGNAYVHATGTVRPVPHETMPQHRTASMHEANTPRSEPREEKGNVHEGAVGHEPGKENEAARGHEPVAGHEPGKENEAARGHEPVAGHEPPKSGHEAVPDHHEAVPDHHEAVPEHQAAADHHEAVPDHQAAADHHEATPDHHEAVPDHEPLRGGAPVGERSDAPRPHGAPVIGPTHAAPSAPPPRAQPPTPKKKN